MTCGDGNVFLPPWSVPSSGGSPFSISKAAERPSSRAARAPQFPWISGWPSGVRGGFQVELAEDFVCADASPAAIPNARTTIRIATRFLQFNSHLATPHGTNLKQIVPANTSSISTSASHDNLFLLIHFGLFIQKHLYILLALIAGILRANGSLIFATHIFVF